MKCWFSARCHRFWGSTRERPGRSLVLREFACPWGDSVSNCPCCERLVTKRGPVWWGGGRCCVRHSEGGQANGKRVMEKRAPWGEGPWADISGRGYKLAGCPPHPGRALEEREHSSISSSPRNCLQGWGAGMHLVYLVPRARSTCDLTPASCHTRGDRDLERPSSLWGSRPGDAISLGRGAARHPRPHLFPTSFTISGNFS